TVCVVGKMRDLILQLSKSSIYSTKPRQRQAFSRKDLSRIDKAQRHAVIGSENFPGDCRFKGHCDGSIQPTCHRPEDQLSPVSCP
ncbi:hypothetical protein PO548_23975, partial [Klebsiella pneumoniae]